MALRSHYWGGYSWLGDFYRRQGRLDEAIENFQQVVQLAPDSWRGDSNLGVAYYFAEDWTQARRAFERALELNPEFTAAISNIGTLYFYEGNYAESVDAYGRAVDLADEKLAVSPNDAEVHSLVPRRARRRGPGGDSPGQSRRAARDGQRRAPRRGPDPRTLGERDLALEYLRQAVEAGYQLSEIELDPVFAELRRDSRYAQHHFELNFRSGNDVHLGIEYRGGAT